jgi:uncharacterized protein YecT (DUF1311 family)
VRYILFCVLIGSSVPTIAGSNMEIEKQYSVTYNNCMNSGDAVRGVTPAMGACITAEMALQDRRLNIAYKNVMQRLSAPKKINLRSSERIWIKERDEQCQEEYASYEGGTMASLAYGTCVINETISRTMWLKKYK